MNTEMNNDTQEFQIEEFTSLHKYRTEVPNIIFTLGLDVYQTAVYLYYKKIAGDKSKCYQSQKTICEALQISQRKLRDVKRSLEQPFPQLDNQPLIRCLVRFKENSKERLPDLITIIDLWDLNMKKFLRPACDAGGVRHVVPGGAACGAGEEDPFKKNPFKKKEKQEKENGGKPPNPPPTSNSEKQVERAKHVKTSQKEHDALVEMYGEEKTEKAYARLSEWKEVTPRTKWKKNDYLSIKRWVLDALADDEIKKKKNQTAEQAETNKAFAERIANGFNAVLAPHKGIRIDVSSQYMEFIYYKNPAASSICIPLKSNGFKDQVENALRKTGLK